MEGETFLQSLVSEVEGRMFWQLLKKLEEGTRKLSTCSYFATTY